MASVLGLKWKGILNLTSSASIILLLALVLVSGDRGPNTNPSPSRTESNTDMFPFSDYVLKAVNFLWQPDGSGYEHVWPPMEFGWKIVLGSLIGFLGAAFGSVGGVGGGGIFVPMLTLIIGFDPKSSTAISKCMIMGAAGSTVYYNLKLRHPTLDMPIIDYDLAVLVQPMLMLGISIGVVFNVVFADWMVTVLLIILFLGTSTKAFLRGVDTWKKETIMKREAANRSALDETKNGGEYTRLPSAPADANKKPSNREKDISIIDNVCWKELGLLVFVWIAFLALQITKNYTENCSVWYWVLNLIQVNSFPFRIHENNVLDHSSSFGSFIFRRTGSCCCGCEFVRSSRFAQWEKSDRVSRRSCYSTGSWAARPLLLTWSDCWYCWRSARAWRWIYLGTLVLGARCSSTSFKCYSNLRYDVLVVNVRRRILSSESFPSATCCLLRRRRDIFCSGGTTCCQKVDQHTRKVVPYHLHPRIHNLRQRNLTGWSWYIKYGSEDRKGRVHGF